MNTESLTKPADPSGPARSDVSASLPGIRVLNQPLVRNVLLLVLTTAYLFPFTHVLKPVGDDGTILYGAQRVSEGAVPGRDFLEVMGPGSFYWLGLFFKLFGAGWEVSRLHLLFTGVVTAGLLYSIARRVCRESSAVLLWLFTLVMGIPLWPTVSHHWDSNLFVFLALWCYLKLERTEHRAWAVAAGSLAAVTTCFMLPKGLLLVLGFTASAVIRGLWPGYYSPSPTPMGAGSPARGRAVWGGLCTLLGSYAGAGIAVMGAFWRAGALRGLVYSNLVWPLSDYHDINAVPYGFDLMTVAFAPSHQIFGADRPIPGLISAGLSFIPFLLLAILPAVFLGAGFAPLFFKEGRRCWSQYLVVTLTGAGLWLSEMHRKDVVHLSVAAPLLLIAVLGSAHLISGNRHWRAGGRVVTVGLVVFGILNFAATIQGSQVVETRRGKVVSLVDDQALRFLTGAVKEGEFVFIYPYCPLYYYLADVRNPTRFSLLLYGWNTPAQFDEVIQSLEEKRVRYVLWDMAAYGDKLRQWFPGYRHPAADKLRLEQYLGKRYEVTAVSGGFRLLQRRAGEADGTFPDAVNRSNPGRGIASH